ncbi:MAG TPA: holo-ACP synthase [Elusimicrobiales bacterium]|nr:holo-ACP synthase [Elusimicrobiales bacterium]HOL61961.1 holo-ACP synthase [Elusimicrobiales bacterium]HPO95996.1 holo-ACP synthase [Elusimicrobiales bacterium]
MNIGIDIVEVKRIKKLIKNPKFINKVFSKEEIDYCEGFKNKDERYSGKFAAKEAFIKALKSSDNKKICGLINKISLKDIKIINKENGMPFVFVKGLKIKGKLSVSHTASYACAVFVWED